MCSLTELSGAKLQQNDSAWCGDNELGSASLGATYQPDANNFSHGFPALLLNSTKYTCSDPTPNQVVSLKQRPGTDDEIKPTCHEEAICDQMSLNSVALYEIVATESCNPSDSSSICTDSLEELQQITYPEDNAMEKHSQSYLLPSTLNTDNQNSTIDFTSFKTNTREWENSSAASPTLSYENGRDTVNKNIDKIQNMICGSSDVLHSEVTLTSLLQKGSVGKSISNSLEDNSGKNVTLQFISTMPESYVANDCGSVYDVSLMPNSVQELRTKVNGVSHREREPSSSMCDEPCAQNGSESSESGDVAMELDQFNSYFDDELLCENHFCSSMPSYSRKHLLERAALTPPSAAAETSAGDDKDSLEDLSLRRVIPEVAMPPATADDKVVALVESELDNPVTSDFDKKTTERQPVEVEDINILRDSETDTIQCNSSPEKLPSPVAVSGETPVFMHPHGSYSFIDVIAITIEHIIMV